MADEAELSAAALLRALPDPCLALGPGPDYRVLEASDTWLRLVQRSRDEVLGRALFDLATGAGAGAAAHALRESLQRVATDGRPDTTGPQAYPFTPADDTPRWWEIDNSRIQVGAGCWLIHRAREVSESHNRALQLDNASGLLRIAERVARIGGWTVDLATQAVDWSDEVARIHGLPLDYRPDVTAGINFYAPEWRGIIRRAFERCVADGTPWDQELQIITAQGERRWVRSTGEAARDEDGRIVGVRGAFQDIHAIRNAADEHARTLARLDAALDSMSDGFALFDSDLRYLYLNAQAERMLRAPREKLVGQLLTEVFPETERSVFAINMREALETGCTVTFIEHYQPLGAWFRVRAYPTREGLAAYFLDITAERALEEQLRQAQRLDAVGQLTGGIAHDFNNLLTVILGNADLLADRLADDAELGALARMTCSAANRGAELTQRLLAFSRKQALAPRLTDIGALAEGMLELLRRTLGEDIEISLERESGLPPVLVDPGQLENALLNLCINSRDAMPGGGQLEIRLARERPESSAPDDEIPAGDYICVSVIDTGHGMEPQVLSQAFEPFFTTKEVGAGSGLGLSMVYGFIRQSHGQVTIDSSPGRGTTVRLFLPGTAGNPEALVQEDASEPLPGGSERILLVEDDVLVRKHAARLLEGLGYEVLEAGDAEEALQVLRGVTPVDLLFTDIVMPGSLNGIGLAAEARRLRPGLPVLFTSGHSEDSIAERGHIQPAMRLVHKPYRRNHLARSVRALLDTDDRTRR